MLTGVLVGLVAVLSITPDSATRPLNHHHHQHEATDWDDGTVRNDRSTNLSHITGTARKIQLHGMRGKLLQIIPDGTVNGTNEDNDFSILQRSSVGGGHVRLQGVATCMFLCLNSCGLLYGSREFSDECIFNETIAKNSYNMYSSVKHSTKKHVFYVALSLKGEPKKVRLKTAGGGKTQSMGKVARYTSFLPSQVAPERVEELISRALRFEADDDDLDHPLRHHGYHQLCPVVAAEPRDTSERDRFQCKRKKKKKKKRKCDEGEVNNDECQRKKKMKKKKKGDKSQSMKDKRKNNKKSKETGSAPNQKEQEEATAPPTVAGEVRPSDISE